MIGKAIFTNDRDKWLLLLKSKYKHVTIVSNKELNIEGVLNFTYKEIKLDYARFLQSINNTVLVLTDIEPIYRYDTPITRFFVNIVSKEIKAKIVLSENMIRNNIYDIYSYMFFLDKTIIDINHYWCFKANHMEENMFTKEPIRMLDIDYLYKKIKPHIIFDKSKAHSELETKFI